MKQPLTLAILGATRGVGLALTRQALARGLKVRVLVRDRKRFALAAEAEALRLQEVDIVQGDATVAEDVRRVVRGVDAVLFALGAPARSKDGIRARATTAVIEAMRSEDIKRIVAVSVLGAHEGRAKLPWFLRHVIFPLFLNRVVRDHEAQEDLLRQSGLAWTAVRPPNLVDRPGRHGVVHGVGEVPQLTMTVSRAELAEFMLDEVSQCMYVRKTPALSHRAQAA
jgi:uncharacterized protein YbjT (DUF2867 family)